MHPRTMLSERLGQRGPGAPQHRPPIGLVLRARTAARSSFTRLGLPLLSAGDRLKLGRAAQRGITQLLRQVARSVARSAELQRALGLEPAFTRDMAEVHGHLLRIVGQSEELLRRAEQGEQQALRALAQVLGRLEEVAERMAAEEAAEPEERQQAQRFVAFVRRFRERAAEQAAAPQVRGRRRVARAEERARDLLRGREVRALTQALLGKEAPAEAPAEAPVPRPRRRGRTEDLVLGTPVARSLAAPPADYGACADALDELLAQLGPAEEGDTGGARIDALTECDLAILVLRLLPGLPWLTAEAGTSEAELEELLDLQEAFGQLAGAAGLLLRGARDGALVAAELVLLVHEQALAWLAGREDAASVELRQELREAEAVLRRGAEEKEAVLSRVERRIAEIEGEAEAALRREEFERTVAEVAAGREVAPERLERALAWKREREARPQPSRRGGRRRPR